MEEVSGLIVVLPEYICSYRKSVRQFKETGRGRWGDGPGWCRSGEKLARRTLLVLQLAPGSATGHLKPKFLRNPALLKYNKTKETQSKMQFIRYCFSSERKVRPSAANLRTSPFSHGVCSKIPADLNRSRIKV